MCCGTRKTASNPPGIIDLATLTGAIIVALGHENTGVFSNDDDLCNAFLQGRRGRGRGRLADADGSGL